MFTKWKYNISVIDTTKREQQKHTETTITEDISQLAKYRKDHKTCLLYSVPVIILDLYRVSVATCPIVAPTTMLHIPVPAIYLLIHNTVNDFCSPIFIVPVLASTRKCINCAKERTKQKKTPKKQFFYGIESQTIEVKTILQLLFQISREMNRPTLGKHIN